MKIIFIVPMLIMAYLHVHKFDKTTSRSRSSVRYSAPSANRFQISRGTNISHWLSQSKKRDEERRQWFTKEDVAYLAKTGYDHLRIPVDEEQLWEVDGSRDTEGFELLHQALGWCKDYRLKVIVDLHILRSHHFDAQVKPLWTEPAAQERFLQCWRDLSDELKKYPNDQVAYELMNEPVANNAEDWNKLVEKAIGVIREKEPKRFIVVGSNRWQSTQTFDQLQVPDQDNHLILSFHFYEPFLLTHHEASWSAIGPYKGPVQYPGKTVPDEEIGKLSADLARIIAPRNKVITKDSLAALIAKPIAIAKKKGLQLYCGEWGCLPSVPEADRLRWYADVRSILEKNNIAWANWDYKGSFGIVDRDRKPNTTMIGTLLK